MAMILNCNGSACKGRSGIMLRVLLVQFMLSLCFFTSIASGMSQNRDINLTFEKATLSQALKQLGEVADCKFVFNYDDLNRYQVSVKLENKSIEESLGILLQDKPFKFEREGEFFVISYKDDTKKEDGFLVKGTVKDEFGLPLPGVTVMIEGPKLGTTTRVDGA